MCLNFYPLSRAFVAALASKTKEGERIVDFGAVDSSAGVEKANRAKRVKS